MVTFTFTLLLALVSRGMTQSADPNIENQLEVNVDISDGDTVINWKYNPTNEVYGFQTVVYKSDDLIFYKSPFLHQEERSMKLSTELEGTGKICVLVYENSTHILEEKCDKYELQDLKVIIGILAGVIFLIPCIIGISYVIYKDFKIQRNEYKQLESIAHKEKVGGDEDKSVYVIGYIGNTDNEAFVIDEEVKSQKKVTPKPSVATGIPTAAEVSVKSQKDELPSPSSERSVNSSNITVERQISADYNNAETTQEMTPDSKSNTTSDSNKSEDVNNEKTQDVREEKEENNSSTNL